MSAGARVDAADENGNGALLAAAGEGRLDAVRWLLAAAPRRISATASASRRS